MLRLLLLLSLPEDVRNIYLERLRAAFPNVQVNVVDHHTKVGPYIASTDILVTFAPMLADHVLEQATQLKWVQALGTGTDGLIDRPGLRPGVLVTNLHGVHGDAMSEAALMSMLALSRELPRSLACQARHAWERFPARLLKGKTVGILGVGAIAENLGPRCKLFGMRVVGITSAPRTLAGFDTMIHRDRLAEVVGELDYLVLLTPYSPATHGLVDERILASMKPSSYLVNLARGGVVDEAALVRALDAGVIAGAALDVFSIEPLPADSPIWSARNIIVTAHQGGFHDGYPASALPVIEENLRRFLAGNTENMLNVVRR